jgi:DNA-binding MarR family transcriptional regulator
VSRSRRKIRTEEARSEPPVASGAETFGRRPKLDFDALDGHLGYFLRRLQILVFKDFISTLATWNVRPAQYSALVLIGANPGRSQAEIGEALNIERARFARLLDDLEKRGWTQRVPALRDRRSHSLFLTNEGRTALVTIKGLAARHEKQVSRVVGGTRRQKLMNLLKDVQPQARPRS